MRSTSTSLQRTSRVLHSLVASSTSASSSSASSSSSLFNVAASRVASRLSSINAVSSRIHSPYRYFSTHDAAPLTPFPVHPPHKLPPRPTAKLDFADAKYKKHVKLDAGKRVIVLGFGAIGQGVLPLLFRHIDMSADQVLVVAHEFTADSLAHAADYKVKTVKAKLTIDDYRPFLQAHIKEGDFLINVSTDVSSLALIEHCQNVGALYIDSCNEPWAGGYSDPSKPASARSNYAFREQVLEFRSKLKPNGPTALITHGANPGIVSHFVKQALLNIAKDIGHRTSTPRTREQWVTLSKELGIKVVHIAEKDTQASNIIKHAGEFVNTWSIEGYAEEGKQPAELGWGTHEKTFPEDGRRHDSGCQAAIYLDRPGANVFVRTWTPKCGNFHGALITHTEAISIADYFTEKDKSGKVIYRPTVNFAYHPSSDAMMSMREVAYQEWVRHPIERVMMTEIVSGRDELGVLLMGHKKGAYWYGSDLTIDEARRAAPNNNATSLQVCTSVLAGTIWTMRNPKRGLIEPEEMDDHASVIEVAKPYLGDLCGHYNETWTPLVRREILFPEPHLDKTDPWQFGNFLCK